MEVVAFPPDAGTDYTGCVWVWMTDPSGLRYWEAVYEFERGEIVRSRSTAQRSKGTFEVTECLYASGKLLRRKAEPADSVGICDAKGARAILPRAYSAKAIAGRVVDAETGKSLEGVVIVANWQVEGGFLEVGVPIAQMNILEAVTDRNGRYFFPAWGPKEIPIVGVLDQSAPTLQLFKPGYRAVATRYANSAFKLERFKGSRSEYAEQLTSLSSHLERVGGVGREAGDYCGWQSFPRMLRALDKLEAEFRAAGVRRGTVVSFLKANDARIRERGCRSVFDVLEEADR